MKSYIRENKISGDIKIWLTGYSRAAATANLVAGALDDGEKLGDGVVLKRKICTLIVLRHQWELQNLKLRIG